MHVTIFCWFLLKVWWGLYVGFFKNIFSRLSQHWMGIMIFVLFWFFCIYLSIHLSRCWSVDQQCGYLLSIHKGNNNTCIHLSIFTPIYLFSYLSLHSYLSIMSIHPYIYQFMQIYLSHLSIYLSSTSMS